MDEWFKERKHIVTRDFQMSLGIINRPYAYQILDGFRILGILKKEKQKNKVTYFKGENWDLAKKAVKDAGTVS